MRSSAENTWFVLCRRLRHLQSLDDARVLTKLLAGRPGAAKHSKHRWMWLHFQMHASYIRNP